MKEMRQKQVEETRNKVKIHQLINFDKDPEREVKVSIIVPVCNVEQYLRECLDSAINQTLQEIEIICVNDGSKDNSLQILEEYAEKDTRVKIIDKDNAGYGHAMNIGMDMARGEYIGILESDDYIKLDMYETLYNIAHQDCIDMVKADFYRFTVDGEYRHLYYNFLTPKQEYYNHILTGDRTIDLFKFTNTWTGIYNADFLRENNIRHQETPGASYQDNGFWFQTTICAKSLYYLDRPFYMNRRDNPNSSIYQREKMFMANTEYKFIYNFIEERPELKEKYARFYAMKKFDNYYYNYRQISKELKFEYLTKFSEEFKELDRKKEIDRTLFSNARYKTLRKIIDAPEEYYEETKDETGVDFMSTSNDVVPIVFICDKGYAIPTSTAIASIVKAKRRNTRYKITIIAVGLSDSDIRRFAVYEKSDISFTFISVQPDEFEKLHKTEITNYGVPTTALIKFLLPDLMKEYSKVIYLDGDIVVKRDLSALFAENIEGYYAGVVRDIPQVLYERQIFGVEYGRDYFNSGMMLLNIHLMREDNLTEVLIRTKQELDSRLMDQDVFNEVFKDKMRQLPIKYNTLYVNLYRSRTRYNISQINNLYKTKYTNLESIRRDSAIIHYCSKDKPWKYYDVPMADIWLEHFLRSSYGEKTLVRHSILDQNEEIECNGNILFEDVENHVPVVFYYTSRNTKEILANISEIKKFGRNNGVFCDFYILKNGDNGLPMCLFEKYIDTETSIKTVELKNMLDRDREYSRSRRLHDNYYRMLIPEILCQYPKIIFVGDTVVKDDIVNYFLNYEMKAEIGYIKMEDKSFWDSPVVFYDTRKFVCNIIKMKFFDEYNGNKKTSGKFALSLYNIIPRSAADTIDTYYFDIAETNNKAVEEPNQNGNLQLMKKIVSSIEEKDNEYIRLLEEKNENCMREIYDKDQYIHQLEYELKATRTSFSCRLGLALTAIPRKILGKK
ncbi:glycosyltransferase [Blautia sp. An46]|uniref:glycosyltransferase n=1 Tax=Blautia sp. An46 TaxID=1965636 RepID=UPI000B3A5687|nr:glycosyltransferase [Blautia sp. An46]OUN94045.1 hypothetical protein B5G00_04070 [Blautia sp. An46]